MGIQIGAKPDSGFDDPLGMLKDCHRRIERFLNILWMVAGRAKGRSLTDEEREAVEAALEYFRVGGRRHNADEEESLFPRMRTEAGENGELARLEKDHRTAEGLHATVEELYRMWIADGGLNAGSAAKLGAAAEALKGLYEAHIRVEEDVVFPQAAGALDKDTIAAIGREFQARRS